MEEVLMLILQGLIEILVQILTYWPLDLPFSRKDDRDGGVVGHAILVFCAGLLGGYLFTLVHPNVFITYSALRIIALPALPALNGALSYGLAVWRRDRYRAVVHPWRHFLFAALFSLGFVIIRFAYGVR